MCVHVACEGRAGHIITVLIVIEEMRRGRLTLRKGGRRILIVVEGDPVGEMYLIRGLRHLGEGWWSMLLKGRMLQRLLRHHAVIEGHASLELGHVLSSIVIRRSKGRTSMLETRHGYAHSWRKARQGQELSTFVGSEAYDCDAMSRARTAMKTRHRTRRVDNVAEGNTSHHR